MEPNVTPSPATSPQPAAASAHVPVPASPAATNRPPVPSPAPAAVVPAQAAVAPAPPASPVSPNAAPTYNGDKFLQLPISVVGRVDVGRLLREVEAIDNFIRQSEVRQPGTQPKLPKTSKFMDDVIAFNRLNVLLEDDRNRLLHFLMEVYSRAPMLHMSFSADPTPLFVQRLMTWLRREIHPLVLLQIGIQPNMGAGCVVRTTNKYFDFSLRSRFMERRSMLAQRLKAGA